MSSHHYVRPVLLFLFVVAITGCAVDLGFNQLDTLKRLSQYRTKAQLNAQLWEVRIGENYQHTAVPVQHEEYMTFYIQDGTEIDFVGWDVTALRNWNYYGKAVRVQRSGAVLDHHFLDESVKQLTCSEYESISDLELENKTLRVANCRGSGAESWQYSNAVVLNDEGIALWMYHHVSPNMPPIELRLRGKNRNASLQEIDYRVMFD